MREVAVTRRLDESVPQKWDKVSLRNSFQEFKTCMSKLFVCLNLQRKSVQTLHQVGKRNILHFPGLLLVYVVCMSVKMIMCRKKLLSALFFLIKTEKLYCNFLFLWLENSKISTFIFDRFIICVCTILLGYGFK